ncbi:lipoprotein [Streptomyces spiroverticillatus]|uniref:Lipoprotein n=1 Tax=Streptomyces finlayi TaxID=67296 RepID=A0A918X3W9_9ACTN|nr:extracellular solute-binding protein [Streptomyces finlayi]GHA26594.1 lipoprotein [Streptomyces spiroverticillatus]GHD08047.1 lipoprotein [Streptomyces finlayi]
MPQRVTSASLATVLSAALLTGCGMLGSSSAEEKTRTVTVWLMENSASPDFLKKFTAGFEAENPGLKLDIQIQPWGGIGPKIIKALQSPTPPDVIEVGNTQVAQYAVGGGLENLTLEAMRDLGSDDWLPGLAEPGSINDAQYGIPWYAANRVVVYHKDLFEQAGIKEPPADREEWLRDTRKLNSGGNQGIYLAGQDWYTLSGFVWDEGGELAVESGGQWTGALDSKAALAGMDFYKKLQALGQGPKDADEEHPPQRGVFGKGKVAQIIATPGTAKLIEEKNPELRGKIGFFPVPGKSAKRPGTVFTGGSDLVVPRASDQRRAAVKVVSALAGDKWQVELARAMNYVPNKSKLASAVGGEEGVRTMAKGAKYGRATPSSPKWGDVEANNPIKPYMTKVLGGADPKTAAKEASRSITTTLQKVGE